MEAANARDIRAITTLLRSLAPGEYTPVEERKIEQTGPTRIEVVYEGGVDPLARLGEEILHRSER